MSRRTLFILGVALCLASCKKDAEPAPTPQAVSAPVLGETVVKKTDPGSVEVKVADPGAEPRRALRYKYRADMKDAMVMELVMRMSMEFGGNSVPEIRIPPVRATIAISDTSLTPSGNLRYTGTWTETTVVAGPDTPRQMVEALEAEYKTLTGLVVKAEVTPRGVVEEIAVTLPKSASQQSKQLFESMEQALRQIMSPLPEEPVGVGASWTVAMKVETQALTVSQEATYRLTGAEGDDLKIDVDITQTAPPQDMAPPGMPAGAKVHLDRLESTGKGKMAVNLGSLVPRVEMTLSSDMAMTVDAEGERQAMKMTMGIDAKMGPAGSKP